MPPSKLNVTEVTADVWRRRPALAIHLAHISQLWNLIELSFAAIFVRLARSDRQAVAAMFLSVQSNPIKLQMLRTLAKDTLPPPDQLDLERLCSRFGRLAKKRTHIIHGVWGINDDYPDSIFITKNFFDLTQGQKEHEYNTEKFKREERDLLGLLVDVQDFQNRLWGVAKP